MAGADYSRIRSGYIVKLTAGGLDPAVGEYEGVRVVNPRTFLHVLSALDHAGTDEAAPAPANPAPGGLMEVTKRHFASYSVMRSRAPDGQARK